MSNHESDRYLSSSSLRQSDKFNGQVLYSNAISLDVEYLKSRGDQGDKAMRADKGNLISAEGNIMRLPV